jgi:rubredoxin
MSDSETLYYCQTANCGYIYSAKRGDKKGGIPKGVAFEDLPDDWKCPCCGVGKKLFQPIGG